MDDASATVSYVGEAAAGCADPRRVALKRIDESAGTSILWRTATLISTMFGTTARP